MKKISLLSFILLLSALAAGQTSGNYATKIVGIGPPVGKCGDIYQFYSDFSNGDVYNCGPLGWVKVNQGASSTGWTLTAPGYFFPNLMLFDTGADPSNIDPRGGGSINLNTSWQQFILPFNVTITRYRFQADGGTWTGGFFYAGIYDSTGHLIFDIGKIDLSPGAGQYGTGAVHDPGTKFFNASRSAVSSVILSPGSYYYAWGAEVATGTLVFPQMGSITAALWGESVNIDTTGISPVALRSCHSSLIDISGGHLPLTISSCGGGATAPPNITFFP